MLCYICSVLYSKLCQFPVDIATTLCTAGTATRVGTAATLYCMLSTAGTATCVGTAAALYCMLCSAGAATCLGPL